MGQATAAEALRSTQRSRQVDATGIKVNIISGKGKALMERLASEGSSSPADVFITVDAGNLWKVQKDGMFQSIKSSTIDSIVPENLRGPNNE